eukprot:gene4337-14451_t
MDPRQQETDTSLSPASIPGVPRSPLYSSRPVNGDNGGTGGTGGNPSRATSISGGEDALHAASTKPPVSAMDLPPHKPYSQAPPTPSSKLQREMSSWEKSENLALAEKSLGAGSQVWHARNMNRSPQSPVVPPDLLTNESLYNYVDVARFIGKLAKGGNFDMALSLINDVARMGRMDVLSE